MKKKIVVVSGGGDVPPELLKAIAEQTMGEMGEDQDEYRPEDEDEDEDENEAGSDPLEKELMAVIKKIVESCQ